MLKTDDEILNDYVEIVKSDNSEIHFYEALKNQKRLKIIDHDVEYEFRKYLSETREFRVYHFNMRWQEFKTALFNALPGWYKKSKTKRGKK